MATGSLYGSTSESTGLYGIGAASGGTYFEWFIFYDSATAPATPTGGSWSFTTNTGTAPTGWLNAPPAAPTNLIWVSISVVDSRSTSTLSWSVPGLMTGSGLPVLSASGVPSGGTGVNGQLYINTATTPQSLYFKQSGAWTQLSGSNLVDLVNNQTIAGTKTFSSPIAGSVTGTAANVTGTVAIANGGTGATTASVARTALGLGTIATQDASSVAITGGSIALTTALPIASGGTAGTSAATARSNLGAVGLTDTQTLTNKTISGASNTFSSIPNSGLSNSTFTMNGQVFTLGAVQTVGANLFLPSYTGNAGKVLALNSSASDVQWIPAAGVGTVTSIDVSGGLTGLTTSGGPITAAGTVTLGGTLAIGSGGTGASTAATARTNLGATTVGNSVFTLSNPSAITFPRFNADNTVSALDAATFRTAIGAGTSSATGTVTSVAASVPAFLSISGSPITTSGTLSIGLSGTALPVANGGTGVTASSGANSVVLRDASANISANTVSEGYSNVAAAGTTTVLTVSSVPNYVVTGSGGQTYQLPDATTLSNGANYVFNNNQSSGTIVVKNNSSTTVATIQAGGYVEVVLLSNATAAGTWDVHNQAPSNVSWSTNTFDYPGSITSATWNGATVATNRGGTGLTSFTANQVFYASSTSAFAQSANLQFSGTDLTVYGLTVGRGAGAVSTNTAVGASALVANTTGANNVMVGRLAGASNTSGSDNTFVGQYSGNGNTTGNYNSFFNAAGYTNTSGTNNTGLGYQALALNTTASNNTAVGYQAAYSNTTAPYITAVGWNALRTNTTGANNAAVGSGALYNNSTGANNTGLGTDALANNTTASRNIAVGYQAGYSNTTGASNTVMGTYAYNSGTTGSYNTVVGDGALTYNTTASNNTAVGYQAGYNSTAANNTFLGAGAGYGTTSGGGNTCVGAIAGYALTTGQGNTFIGGAINGVTDASGRFITTGSKNSILGCFSGNQGGLDIRTASNYIVLSDGDGNPRGIFDGSGRFLVNTTSTFFTNSKIQVTGSAGPTLGAQQTTSTEYAGGFWNSATGSTNLVAFYSSTSGSQVGGITFNGSLVLYNTTSDSRLKDNIQDAAPASELIDAIKVRQYDWKTDGAHQQYGFVAQELITVAPEAVHQPADPEEMMAVDYSKLVPMLVKEIQSLRKRLADAGIA